MNFCFRRGYLAGPGERIPDDPHHFNWGRSGEGCSRLVCDKCHQPVDHQLSPSGRSYRCECTQYTATGLEWLDEVRYEGPGDCITVEMPPWSCAGHPLPELGPWSPAALEAIFADLNLFQSLDRAYHYGQGSERGPALAEQLSRRAGASRPKRGLRLAACRFYRLNPEAAGWEVLSEIARSQPKDRKLVRELCLALASRPAQRDALRGLALQPGSAALAVEVMEFDEAWLLQNAAALFQIDPATGPWLYRHTACVGYQWDQQALAQLPLEVIRPHAATMPRRGPPQEVHLYWERDFAWLCAHYAELCRKASDFPFYSREFFEGRGWRPDEATVAVWRQQAGSGNDCYNVIPHLIRDDRDWLVEHLVEVVKKSGVRGIWVLDALHQARVDIHPLVAPVRALDRDGDIWEQSLRDWFGNDNA